MQDQTATEPTKLPSAKQLEQSIGQINIGKPLSYYNALEDCTIGCESQGVFIPYRMDAIELDELFDFNDIELLPHSDEVFPIIFDDALMTEEGLKDSFARHYPERALILYEILGKGDAGGLGYKLEYIDNWGSQYKALSNDFKQLDKQRI